MTKQKILLIDDNVELLREICEKLSPFYKVYFVTDPKNVETIIKKYEFSLVLLDLNFFNSTINGIDLCKRIRAISNCPIIIITVQQDIQTKLKIFDLGADDYLIKPFNLLELKARIDSQIRRTSYLAKPKDQTIDINLEERKVFVFGKEIKLRKKEFEMVCLLKRNSGIVITRQMFLNKLWSEKEISSNTIDAHVTSIRRKIKKVTNSKIIITEHGLGYKIKK